ncbi:uncharacterized protein A1O5_09244 [Cladophialophora psammophila CBS 110553]|uniref:CorA-like transporter domain-containing protein n=1 Tax=Cladophialophora psammophila CBS 110553 TaxID=1182543 RepID=W9WIG0_9EURO|nr:uncharacterized protein A1O5_09244 [Cladophialophora psammophila CBS 110553]EXJ67897.1 hypothetical protein A1O5_09244 [Cladophialophora psammophila CBS 110553]
MSLVDFHASCRRAQDYPANLIDAGPFYPSVQQEYRQALARRAPKLFCPENRAAVELFYYDDSRGTFESKTSRSVDLLRQQLTASAGHVQKDKQCLFVFVGARNSRDVLYISQDMMTWILSVFQVLPIFLEFLFAFGQQLYAVDSQFSGFREDRRLEPGLQRNPIPELDRSGQDFQICYNLKSFERKDELQWPWSNRQVVVFHSFDVQNGHATWIVVKANDIIRGRLKEVSATLLSKSPDTYSSIAKKFTNSLACHLVIVEWCGENWRWCMNDIEEQLHTLKRRALVDKVAPVATFAGPTETILAGNQGNTLAPRRTWTLRAARTRTNTTNSQMAPDTNSPPPLQLLPPSIAINVPDEPQDPPNLPPEYDPKNQHLKGDEDQNVYRIEELQEAQALENIVNDAGLVLKSDIAVLSRIEDFYHRLATSSDLEHLDPTLRRSMQASVAQFSQRVQSLRNDLGMHLNRIETISKLIAECKTLLYGIVEYQSMQANKAFALEARASAKRMEELTEQMKHLTLKTTFETVLMRIITVVTVFFLPATFVSTLMSTDIVRFSPQDSKITSGSTSLGAVKLFLCLTLSLMAATFGSGFALYWGALRYGG